jgi:hypothetical protein
MKAAAMLFVLTILGVCLIARRSAAAQDSSGSDKKTTRSTFYCNRLALSPEQLHRKLDLGKTLLSLRRSTRELDDGYEFELPPDSAAVQQAAEWAAMEKLCCPFLKIDLRLDPGEGPFWLVLSGKEGVKQFIRADFSRWF